MAELVTVQLFPPVPAGLRGAGSPIAGQQILVPIPCYEYQECMDVDIDERQGRQGMVTFTTQRGDRIESNLPFIVKRETKGEGTA